MSRSERSVDHLFRHYSRALNSLVRRRVGVDDAEDIIQEAYLRLLELENAEEIVDPRGYLFRIASNMAIDWSRRRRTRMAYFVEDAEFDERTCGDFARMRALEHAITLRCVQLSLARLPRPSREMFLLSRLYGMSYLEIAERFGVSLRTVNRNIGIAVDHLLQFVVDDKTDDGTCAGRRSRPEGETIPLRKTISADRAL
ncbi:RNA polymerase sigma factor [Methylosinus sp. Ce-a6]|uniref:RNA polymerase sigma factor n=1 Tax=Methylosinus sp. Ce-a6 TaxID=2172005 RepID=UPI00135C5610